MASVVIEKRTDAERSEVTIKEALHSTSFVISLAVILITLIMLYHPALLFWWSKWFEKESYYSHGLFVPAASAYIIWFNRHRLKCLPLQPSPAGYILIFASGALGWFAYMGASASVMGLTIPLYLFGITVSICGRAAARVLAFPIAFLFFAAVVPESLLTALSFKAQLFSVATATIGLKLLGISAISRGAYIEFPRLTVEIASACSGFRLAISMLAIASFLAYIRSGTIRGKLTLVALAVPIGLFINSIRIMAISLIGLHWGKSTMIAAHDWTGYIILVPAAALLLLLARFAGCGNYRKTPQQ